MPQQYKKKTYDRQLMQELIYLIIVRDYKKGIHISEPPKKTMKGKIIRSDLPDLIEKLDQFFNFEEDDLTAKNQTGGKRIDTDIRFCLKNLRGKKLIILGKNSFYFPLQNF